MLSTGGLARASATSEGVLAEINLARTQPQAYARIVAAEGAADRDTVEAVRFLERATALPPLATSAGLDQSSQLHVSEQGATGGCGHGSGWNTPFSRMNKFGEWIGMAGENISYGRHSARGIVCSLIVDRGVSGRGHRKNIFSRAFGVAGAAVGPHASYGSMCVIDFAQQYVERGSRVAGL